MSNAKGQWAVIIDTDRYSGNFEREMGAFITGYETIRGERFVKDIREAYGFEPRAYGADWATHEENPFRDLFIEWPGEHGDELSHIHPTPGFWNDGHGTHIQGEPSVRVRNNRSLRGPHAFPAYQSVIMRCTQEPTAEQVRILTEWAQKFSERTNTPKPEWTAAMGRDRNLDPFYFQQSTNILGVRVVCDPNDKPQDFSN